jgi:hypothetical protein
MQAPINKPLLPIESHKLRCSKHVKAYELMKIIKQRHCIGQGQQNLKVNEEVKVSFNTNNHPIAHTGSPPFSIFTIKVLYSKITLFTALLIEIQ